MISLVIPTRNRYRFLRRLIQYYCNLQVRHPILIADGSSDDLRGQAKLFLGQLPENFSYYPFPENSSLAAKLAGVLDHVDTRYTAINADDDFLVPASVECATQFMETHPEYSVACGKAVSFTCESEMEYGTVTSLGSYRQRSIEHGTATQRLLDHLSNYSVTAWSVHRTDQLRDIWSKTDERRFDINFEELLPSCLSLIQGKAKKLDVLYMGRQAHSDQHFVREGKDAFDRIVSPTWPAQYRLFQDCLAKELARQDNIGIGESREVVKQALWSYLAKGLSRRWQARYAQDGSSLRSRLREVAHHIPGLRIAWHKVRSFLPGEDNEMSLEALLRPSSPYHKDFLPIYRAITTPRPGIGGRISDSPNGNQ